MFFDSRRSAVLAKNGMVATSQPLAALAGLQMLMQGGNAVDAAVACAAALNVVEPESTGVGGDMFALIWNAQEKQVRALNGSGRAPAAASIDELKSAGHRQMPGEGPYSVSIPGTVHGWETILAAHGSMPLSEVLKPAIRYAEEGFPVTDFIAHQWSGQQARLSALPSGQEMLLNGRPPRQGEMMRLPTLERRCEPLPREAPTPFTTGKSPVKLPTLFRNRAVGLLPAIWLTTPPIGMKQLPPTTGESPAGSVRPTARVLPLWRR